MLLPDLRQEGDWDCGKATFRLLCRWWEIEPDPKLANLATPHFGLSPDTLWAALVAQGLRVQVGSWSIPLLKATTKEGVPVACLVQFDGCGHWVTVGAVSRGRVHFQCPTRGPVKQPLAEWDRNWRDSHWSGGSFHRFGIAAFVD